MKTLQLGKRTIGNGNPVLIVAEISGNHNHNIQRAFDIIHAAAEAGADAIKLQTYTADTITLNSNAPEFLVKWQGKSQSLYELYQEAYTPWEWHQELFACANQLGLLCFSTPFDPSAVEFLEKLNTPLYKIASFEVVDIPLLEAVGKTKKPIMISRGMATLEELEVALQVLRKNGSTEITILQCVSAYPAKPSDMHLKNIPDLIKRFNIPVGLSDHTLTNDCAIAATALGASIIEKHLTLNRSDGGPDSEFSLEPHEFAALVSSIRIVEQAIGEPNYARNEDEKAHLRFRKSLFASAFIKKGEEFTPQNVRSVRPGAGLPPQYYHDILGKRATREIPFATPLSWDLIEGGNSDQ